MSKRLPELLRQRALLQEHLAWLDREIAAEQGSAPAAPLPLVGTSLRDVRSPATLAANPTPAPTTPPPLPERPTDAEKILAQYQQDPGALNTGTRRAVLKFFGYAALVSVLLAILAYWLYARHLGRWW